MVMRLPVRYFGLFFMIFLLSCTNRSKWANEQLTVPHFINSGQVRIDGFYYRIAPNEQPASAEAGKYFVSVMYLFRDGTAHYSAGFSTNDTSKPYIKQFTETKLAGMLEKNKSGWGKYAVANKAWELEYFYSKTAALSSLGLIRLTGAVETDTAVLIQQSLCDWCDFQPAQKTFNPAERYVFIASGVRPDSSKAFFKE